MKMNARRLIHELGGQAEVQRKLEAAGFTVSKSVNHKCDTIEKWCVRGSIPGEWLVRLSQIAKFDLATYKIPTKRTKRK